jgi:hypothetical protein
MYLTVKKISLVFGFAFVVNTLPAQEIPSRANDGITSAAPREARKDAYFNLKLTKEQQKELQVLNKENREKARDISADSTLAPKEKREKMSKT